MTTLTDCRGVTADVRAAFLRELAENVESERRFHHQPFTDALPAVLPAVCSMFCPDPAAAFDRLVDAVSELSRFDGDERGYCDTHDLPSHERALVNVRDRLVSDVDAALQALLGAGA